MGRFSRLQSKQQTVGSPKQQGPVKDLFKTNTEPSRDALAELFRQLGGTVTMEGEAVDVLPEGVVRSRSRSNTINSDSPKRSVRSKKSISEASISSSQPPSLSGFSNGGISYSDRPDSPARSVLSKNSSLFKRPTSRMNLSTTHNIEGLQSFLGDPSLERSATSVQSPEPKAPLGRTRREKFRKNISAPFDFLHLTHTDQHHVDVLNRTRKADLVSEFSAIRAGQKAGAELKGIHARDISTSSTSPALSETAVEHDLVVESPPSPPGAEPSPKAGTGLLYSVADVCLSRSLENFSRPTPRSSNLPSVSHVFPDSNRSSVTQQSLLPVVDSNTILQPLAYDLSTHEALPTRPVDEDDVVASFRNKPLPQVPVIIHAISTKDESALPLRTAPLPRVPEDAECLTKSSSSLSLRPQSQHGQLRHMQTFPSARLNRHDTVSLRDSVAATNKGDGVGVNIGDAQHTTIALMQKLNEETPHLNIRNGRTKPAPVEMDEWDAVIDSAWEQDMLAEAPNVSETQPALPSDPDEDLGVLGKAAYTRVPVKRPVSQLREFPRVPQPSIVERPLSIANDHEYLCPPFGLGIKAGDRVPSMILEEQEPSCEKRISSSISNDSSHDSLIFSMASSIMGTDRSSASSINLSDFGHIARYEDFMRRDAIAFGKTSQETIREGTHSPSIPKHSPRFDNSSAVMATTIEDDRLTALPQVPMPVEVPARKSSVMKTPERLRMPQKRSSTISAKPKLATRTSYSLFPSSQPTTSA